MRRLSFWRQWIRAGLRRTAWPCTRTVPFLVVPGRSWNEHDQKSNLERNDPEQGTTRFQKNGNEWNEVVSGTRSFLVVLRVRAQHRNGILEWERPCARTKFGSGLKGTAQKTQSGRSFFIFVSYHWIFMNLALKVLFWHSSIALYLHQRLIADFQQLVPTMNVFVRVGFFSRIIVSIQS